MLIVLTFNQSKLAKKMPALVIINNKDGPNLLPDW